MAVPARSEAVVFIYTEATGGEHSFWKYLSVSACGGFLWVLAPLCWLGEEGGAAPGSNEEQLKEVFAQGYGESKAAALAEEITAFFGATQAAGITVAFEKGDTVNSIQAKIAEEMASKGVTIGLSQEAIGALLELSGLSAK